MRRGGILWHSEADACNNSLDTGIHTSLLGLKTDPRALPEFPPSPVDGCSNVLQKSRQTPIPLKHPF
jgi:hypothetical protein